MNKKSIIVLDLFEHNNDKFSQSSNYTTGSTRTQSNICANSSHARTKAIEQNLHYKTDVAKSHKQIHKSHIQQNKLATNSKLHTKKTLRRQRN